MPAQWIETRDVPVGKLTRFPGNARRGNVNEIRRSIRANGQYRSLVVRQCGDGQLMILAGNHTYDAVCAEGRDMVRCEVITCTDQEARKINLADNRLSDLAIDDADALVELLSYLDGDYEGTGWTETNVEFMITPQPDLGDLDDEYEQSQAGDWWPVLRFRVHPEVRNDFYDLTIGCESHDDTARFLYLLDRVRALAAGNE